MCFKKDFLRFVEPILNRLNLCGDSGSKEECPKELVQLLDLNIKTGKTSEESNSSEEEISYYNGDSSLPVFQIELKGNSFSAVNIVHHVLFIENDEIICTVVPIHIQDDVVFMVDNSKFEHIDDLKSDDLGVWRSNKVASDYFLINGSV